MASLSPFLIVFSITLFFFSPVSSITCSTQKLPSTHSYTNCTNLPTLNATLHSTYNATNHSLSVAFAADSPKSDGWVSWGINPTAPKMFGAGALIATKISGKTNVNTYNLISASVPYKQEKLSFDVWDLSVEDVNGVITIFASVKVPEKGDSLNQLWQVGPITNGTIGAHALEKVNLGSTAPLEVAAAAVAPSGSESGSKNGGVKIGKGLWLGFVLVLMSFINM
ncbi:hypothetical protein TanjilG_14240 [Lupinus angustifolius]|uniref:DOMON domain-containing protein n=1 Tax=Lupinus angustifolius TaxID=3871 RepID=A0A1J7HFB3_LUPAN|nr:PREDICTED: auxin-induced in root cultures protein 12-like [Lupinus angustifolius]OIW01057.1 hypothetical protein TanjilG_14240 [Lupinus angustifolius]